MKNQRSIIEFFFLWMVFVLLGFSSPVCAMDVPLLSARNEGVRVHLSWTSVPGASHYLLRYSSYPDATLGDSWDVGLMTELVADLWDGAAFYVAIRACDVTGCGDDSSIELFSLSISNETDDDGDGFTENQGDWDDGDPRIRPDAESESLAILETIYRAAVRDAEVPEPEEISKALTAILPGDPKLLWQDGRVKVVTWLSYDTYDNLAGQSYTTGNWYTWVTVVPEIIAFFANHPTSRQCAPMRIAQLLGMPPGTRNSRFAELWVDPRDLFRPGADPEITDHEAEIDFPDTFNPFLTISPDYKVWFNDRVATTYGEDGYPWTRLGYTYDWSPRSPETGLSEFVLRPHSTVIVGGVKSTQTYIPTTGP
jgi:hypothetical protein